MSGVQRFLSNHKNEVRTAALLSGPVQEITDAVLQKPIARQGSSSGVVNGTFTGDEEALYEIEVVDTIATVPLVTAPIFSGVGNGVMDGIVATALSAREIEVELTDLGNVLKAASTELQGIQVIVKVAGEDGNDYKLRIDRSGLTFTPQAYSLLNELEAGASAVSGPEFDWDTKYAGSDGVVPTNAHRITFGSDQNNIYVQYKKQVDNAFSYVFEPSIKQNYAAKSVVNFVTGTYTVRLYKLIAMVDTLQETYTGIVTLYDLLNKIKTESTILQVVGAVAYDRTAGGQALLELALNTDARFISNGGEGSQYADGFTDVSIEPGAPTELIEATCIAATYAESPGAGLGYELWEVRGSVSGLIRADAQSGDIVANANMSVKIPQKLPEGYTALPRGSFTVKDIVYDDTKRTFDEAGDPVPPHPPICVDSMTLGVNASEQLITLTYKKRPVDDNCACTTDNTQALNPDCLGTVTPPEEGGSMAYSAATIARLVALYDWQADTVRSNSSYFSTGGLSEGVQDPFVSQPGKFFYTTDPGSWYKGANFALRSLFDIIVDFEKTLAEVDKLSAGALRTAAEAAWDAAVAEMENDVDTELGGAAVTQEVFDAYENLTIGDAVVKWFNGTEYLIRKAIPGSNKAGFALATVTAGNPATIVYYGQNDNIVDSAEVVQTVLAQSLWTWCPSVAFPGQWVKNTSPGVFVVGDPDMIQNTCMTYIDADSGVVAAPAENYGISMIADRYKSRLQHVLISGGISPLGKSDADSGGGDGCWRDNGDAYYWEVVGGDGDSYAPAFNRVPYYSAKRFPGGVIVNGVTTATEGYYSTREFGFILDIPCEENLKVGDTVTLRIGNAQADQTYLKGDKLLLGIIAAQDLAFFGGNDGDNIQTWLVTDSVIGPRASYALDTDTPVPYNVAGLEFLITPGTLAFAKGDKYNFAIEGGHFKWRKTVGGVVGAWSAVTPIDITPLALDEGLSLNYTLGASPAFFTGDVYKFTALQPYALSNLIKPDFDMWQWGNLTPAQLVIDFGANKTVEALGIAFHTIPAGATLLLEGGVAPGVYLWSEAITWAKDVIGKLFTAQTARYIRLTITNGQYGGIGWFYVGPAVAFTHSAQVSINREYKINRSSGVNPYSMFKGKAVGSQIQWPEGYLTEDDYEPLLEMLDWLKGQNDESLMFFPQATRQTEVVLGSVESDDIVFNDVYNFQPNTGVDRRLSCTIPLKGVAFK